MPDLPKRKAGGHQVTGIVLEVIARREFAQQISETTLLPDLPRQKLNEMQLAALLSLLAEPALRAWEALQNLESKEEASEYPQPSHERIQIKLFTGDRLIGRVNGAQQTFDLRGKMTSQGVLTPVDTHKRNQGGETRSAQND